MRSMAVIVNDVNKMNEFHTPCRLRRYKQKRFTRNTINFMLESNIITAFNIFLSLAGLFAAASANYNNKSVN